jgi:hypothetical protein
VKKILLDNLATKFMALFLAVLTWSYLFKQGTDAQVIEVKFVPKIDLQEFASVTFRDSDDRVLEPGSSLKVRVTGPKGDVTSLRPRFYVCEIPLDAGKLKEPHGTLTLDLDRSFYDLPPKFTSADALPSRTITIQYAKYVAAEIELLASPGHYVNEPAADYQIESIIPRPAKVKARIPADRADLARVPIERVDVDGRQIGFTVDGRLDPAYRKLNIQHEPFSVDVKILRVPKSARLTLDLAVSAKPDIQKRVELETRSITVELRGPEELVKEAGQRPAAFQAYVVVTDKDMDSSGPKNLGEIGCHILDRKLRDQIEVVLMPDQKPEDRQVKIKVLPK